MVEAIALTVSLMALLVSAASLYLTSLKAADIQLDLVRDDSSPLLVAFSGPDPVGPGMRFKVVVSNGGARGGVLHSVDLAEFTYLGRTPHLWIGAAGFLSVNPVCPWSSRRATCRPSLQVNS